MLKELGFDSECIYHYKYNSISHSTVPTFEMKTPFGKNHNENPIRASAPLWQQVEEWLWNSKWRAFVEVQVTQQGYSCNVFHTIDGGISDWHIGDFDSPLTAKREGVKLAVKYLHSKNQ